MVAGDLLCKGRGRAEVIVAVIIHSGSFLKQLLYRLNPHYLGFFKIFVLLKPLLRGAGNFSRVSLPCFLFCFCVSKSETENTVWTSLEKKKKYKSPPGDVGGWFAGGLDFPGLLNGEVFLFF